MDTKHNIVDWIVYVCSKQSLRIQIFSPECCAPKNCKFRDILSRHSFSSSSYCDFQKAQIFLSATLYYSVNSSRPSPLEMLLFVAGIRWSPNAVLQMNSRDCIKKQEVLIKHNSPVVLLTARSLD